MMEVNGKHIISQQQPIMPDTKKTKSIVKIGEYALGEKIGSGAFGKVYKGLHLKTGEFVAIKQIDLVNKSNSYGDNDNGSALVNIKSEVEILSKLNHNNIVKVIGVVEYESQLNFILEYVENGSLRDIIERFGPLSEELCLLYLYQLLQGLAYLHANNVIHRDIKCSNVLITKTGAIKLADFGVASKIESETQLKFSTVGTPYWMSPESIEMSGCSSASDIWSLAASMVELLTCNPPYFTLQPMAALFRICSDPHPPYPTNVSKDFLNYFEQSFQKDPNMRPTAMELLQHPMFAKLNQKPQPSYSELQSTLKTLNGGRSRLRTSVSSIDWSSSNGGGGGGPASSNTTTPSNSLSNSSSSSSSFTTTATASTPSLSLSSSSIITTPPPSTTSNNEEINKLTTTIKQQANTISNLSEEILSLKKELKEKPKLEEVQFYKEYFMAIAISVKVNQCEAEKQCEQVDIQKLFEMARSQEISWYKLIDWIPKQLIKDNSNHLNGNSSNILTSSASLNSISLSSSSSSTSPLSNSSNGKNKTKKFGFFT